MSTAPRCSVCKEPLQIPEKDGTFLPCPKCGRVYCDHPPAERGDGICPKHPGQSVPKVFEYRYRDLEYRYEIEPINEGCVKARMFDMNTMRLEIGENCNVGVLVVDLTVRYDGQSYGHVGEFHLRGDPEKCRVFRLYGPESALTFGLALQRLFDAASRHLQHPDWMVYPEVRPDLPDVERT